MELYTDALANGYAIEHAAESRVRSSPVWVCESRRSLMVLGLVKNLSEKVSVHLGREPPRNFRPHSAILCCEDVVEQLSRNFEHVRSLEPKVCILVLGPYLDLSLAWRVLRMGARGYIHAGLEPDQILRAVSVAEGGELVAPRKLMEYVIENEAPQWNLEALSARQREILDLVAEGLTNAEISHRLFISESTVKQHLYAAYRLLGVNNRTEAARAIRSAG